MVRATSVSHRLGYDEFFQELPRAYEENDDGLLQGLTVHLALGPHSFWSVFETGPTKHRSGRTGHKFSIFCPRLTAQAPQFACMR